MTNDDELLIYEVQTFNVGEDTFIDCTAESGNTVAFEDNTETGYFYAIDRENNLTILDGLHIYNVADISEKSKAIASTVKILWTKDGTKSFLYLNDNCHAMFDFEIRAGYCKNSFPDNMSDWTKIKERKLTGEMLDKWRK